MSDIFDFGFTAVNEHELESVREAQINAKDKDAKVDQLYNAVIPLLSNLKKNPDKDYIYWPNRVGKIEEFEALLLKIYNSQSFLDDPFEQACAPKKAATSPAIATKYVGAISPIVLVADSIPKILVTRIRIG